MPGGGQGCWGEGVGGSFCVGAAGVGRRSGPGCVSPTLITGPVAAPSLVVSLIDLGPHFLP